MLKHKIDKKDKRILRELDINSRVGYADLAKKLSMPPETIRYRVEKLLSLGIIRNFLPVIDGGRLGYYYYKVFLKLHNVRESDVQNIIESLAANPRICWVVRVDEVYDVGFTPRVSNPAEQSALMDQIRRRYSKYLLSWTLSVNVHMEFLTRDHLLGVSSRRAMPLGSYSVAKKQIPLDSLNTQIISALSSDVRASARDIATTLPISPDTVLDRIRFLEREKVIVRYSYVPDFSSMGYLNYYVLIYLNELSIEREEAFIAFCRKQPNIVYMIKSLGAWDYEINVEVSSIDDYRNLMQMLNREFADIVQQTTGMLVRTIHKYVYP
jgi:DNA-binding Lrp family transcriptional regulator